MSDNSDYDKKRTDLYKLLPDVLKSDTNHAVFENLFNRFLTKQETYKVAGYIGEGNPNAIVKRQIQEPTVHRQGYQLQPILYNKIGSVEWMASWQDLLNEAERLGISKERLPEWLNLLQFNWVPPIDIDKLIHYRDYYWYDEDNPSSQPQYITIRSRCATATAYANFQQNLVDQYGETIATIDALSAEGSGGGYDKLVVSGEYTGLFEPGFVFFYKNSTNAELNQSFWKVEQSEYDGPNDRTIITINTVFTNPTVDGVISQKEKLDAANADRDCQCTGSVGWDIFQWDDNPEDPLWGGEHETLLAAITNSGPPPSTGSPLGTLGQLWYDDVADILYQFDGTTWKIIWNNFSLILEDTAGIASWDLNPGCGNNFAVTAADQWISENKWFHKSDIPNFSIAKQAQVPIIEYDWDLELNEWTYTTYNWKYREDNFATFETTDLKPQLIELIPLEKWTQDGEEIVLDEEYGDLTDYFAPGRQFSAVGLSDVFEVDYSVFKSIIDDGPRHTRIKMTSNITGSSLVPSGTAGSPVVSPTPLRPVETSSGDSWKGYDVHWLFIGQNDTVPVNHQPENDLTNIPFGQVATIHPSGDYEFTFTYYTQESTMLVDGVTDIILTDGYVTGSPAATDVTLRKRALVGFNDVRVYINDIRQYGTYDELTEQELASGSPSYVYGSPYDDQYVAGIRFLPGFEPSKFDTVRIEVGEASTQDIGYSAIPVRTTEDNATFISEGKQTVSLIQYRKAEQVKYERNQYPIFDIYNVDGSSAYKANHIFGFVEDPEADVNTHIGMRLATDVNESDFVFEQLIVDESDGTMYAYRHYAQQDEDIWVDPENDQVYFWDGLTWSNKTVVGDYYIPAIVSNTEPQEPWNMIIGAYWYDSLNDRLNQLIEGSPNTWEPVTTNVVYAKDDNTLLTIWRKGLNNERYVPVKRDWEKRTLEEYNEQKDLFVEQRVDELVLAGTSSSDALTQATQEWFEQQSNHLSPDGQWVGDWEIPDPLYFNYAHENRKTLTSRELLTHFDTIIQAQPKIPGFEGPRENMFHLITTHDVNYGLGGKIKEFNNGFDTFLSSLFIKYLSPRALYNFAHDQYEFLLNNLKELFRNDAVSYLTNTSVDSIINQSNFISQQVIDQHEQNDFLGVVYGDSSTFTEVDGVNDLGIRNWIATLPYIKVVDRHYPGHLIDADTGINEVVHHDGHRNQYNLTEASVEGIIQSVLNTPDERTRFPTPSSPPIDTFGYLSTSLPPNNTTDFASEFNTTIENREGVYWYYNDGSNKTLYRLNLVDIGTSTPSTSYPDGSLWLDLTSGQEVLRVLNKDTNTWNVVDGLAQGATPIRLHNGTDPSDLNTANVSAWQEVNLNYIVGDIITDAEKRLYENAPEPFELNYDVDDLEQQYPQLFEELLEEAFFAYTNENQISTPLINDDYTMADPFTWNYKFSTINTVPSSDLNTGMESGGDWRDLYQKLYNTPYPHLEPWLLQGYDDKPQWWDQHYRVTTVDDVRKWGNRRWKYKHGFDIVSANTGTNTFTITGDFTDVFTPGSPGASFEVEISSGNDGVYNVISSTYNSTTNQTTITVSSVVDGTNDGRILVYNDAIGTYGGYGMWENIRTGIIPAGVLYPNGLESVTGNPSIDGQPLLPKFNYFSVNIGNDDVDGYQPDDVFPPLFTNIETGSPSTLDVYIRSVFSSMSQIVSPGADYSYGDAGPVEWEWRNSSQFLYDRITVAFKLDPVRFVYQTFGPEFHNIAGLQINQRTEKVFSHTDTLFHGDILNNQPFYLDGTNQWYVNFARYSSLDISMSDFRSQWTLWTAPMMYQFASFIDTPSLDIGHRQLCLSEFDYNIAAKRSPGVDDYWIDSFEATLISIPSKVIRYDANFDQDWEIELRTKAPIGNTINYYDVHNYQFYADPTTDQCSIYTWAVAGVDTTNNTFSVSGNQTSLFKSGLTFDINNSTGNDGTYEVLSSVYNVVNNQTIITVDNPVTSSVVDGILSANYRTLPWETGDRVILSTHGTLPIPLQGDNVNGVYEYFVIVDDDTHFKLALTKNDALSNNYVNITSIGASDHFVGQLSTTFNTNKTTIDWRHYVVDTRNLLQFTPPYTVRGLQTVINIIDGYNHYKNEQGWRINSDNSLKDFDNPSRIVSWQLELERFIDFANTVRDTRRKVTDSFEVTVDTATDELTFVSGRPQFITGDPVSVIVSNNVYPTPLAKGVRYYMIRDSLTTFRLAATKADATAGVAVDITSTAGAGQISITEAANLRKDRPRFELNPFRNGIWFRPSKGIVSNVITGPTEDIFNTQLLLDQYSRKLGRDAIRVFRHDKETMIDIADNIPNDVQLTSIFNDPYNYIHLASAHLFVDTYEHVMVFNNETTEGLLMYDPFIGLNVTKFEMLFNRQSEFTQRPNVGGHYLETFFNQGADLKRNIEAQIEDLRYLYDTYNVFESNPLVAQGRESLGYEGRKTYLDNINLNAKSQFAFWRGQIQNKGSINSVEAFINSRRFIDAKVDEYWAVKIADFGSDKEKEYISMYISTVDARSNTLRLHFIPADQQTGEEGFEPISINDQDRWFNQPDQLAKLRNNGGTLYFDMKPTQMVSVDIVGSPAIVTNLDTKTTSSYVNIRHNMASDFVSITVDWCSGNEECVFVGSPSSLSGSPTTVTLNNSYIPFADSIRVFKDGVQLVEGVDYFEIDGSGLTSNQIEFAENIIGSSVKVVYKTSTLTEGIHFTNINSNIVQLKYPELISTTVKNFKIWGWIVDKERLNPAKVIDTKSEVVINPVQIWDPARGFHYHNSLHIIDLQNDNDPAYYTNTLRDNQQPETNVVFNNPWNEREVGTTWLDTSNLDYVPYYDTNIFTDTDERSRSWGSLADWSVFKIYTWVESDVPPEEWDALAEQEEGDASIPESERKSGRVKTTTYRRERTPYMFTATPEGEPTSGSLTVNLTSLYGTTSENDETGLFGGWVTRYFVPTTYGSPTTVTIPVPEYLTGQNLLTVTLNGTPVSYTEASSTSVDVSASSFDEDDIITIEAAPATYTADLNIDGTVHTVVFTGDDAQDFKTLLQQIRNDLNSNATIELVGNNIIITSNTAGMSSKVELTEPSGPSGSPVVNPVFASLINYDSDSSIAGQPTGPQTFTISPSLPFNDGDTVIVSSDGTLPTGLEAGQTYTVTNAGSPPSPTSFNLDGVTITDSGDSGPHYVVSTNFGSWEQEQTIKEYFDVAIDGTTVQLQQITAGEEVSVYVNGTLSGTTTVDTPSSFDISLFTTSQTDRVHVVKFAHEATEEELEFDPEVEDDGTVHVQYDELFEYTADTYFDNLGIERTQYYFWVEDKATRNGRILSPKEAQEDMVEIPVPYVFFQGPQSAESVDFGASSTVARTEYRTVTSGGTETITTGLPIRSITSIEIDGVLLDQTGSPSDYQFTVGSQQLLVTIPSIGSPPEEVQVKIEYVGSYQPSYDLPVRFTQAVVRGLRGVVDDDFRYVLRWTRDFTLRDTLESGATPLQNKNFHEQWELIRREQPFLIPRWLWNKVTESIVGYKLDDTSERVPSLERELYDTENDTSTQYGLGDGQAFVDGELALATILADLNNPENDFTPIDINTFFQNHNFDTDANVVDAMDTIYNTFPFIHVNRMFFDVLLDALSLKGKYEDIFKTSMVALHGIRPFQSGGLFDD